MLANQDSDLKVYVDGSTKELVIRHGDAAPVILPVKCSLQGNIFAPGRYLFKMTSLIDPKKAVVQVDRKNGKISFNTDPRDKFADSVLGELCLNEDLLKFKINQQKLYSQKELVQFIRMNRIFFLDREKHTELVAQLSNLSFSQNIDGVSADDRRGNKTNMLQKKANVNVEMGFSLNIPIYNGLPENSFRVDILLDVTDSETKFWLESVELEELKTKIRENVLNKELEAFNGFVILETN